jgi:hypothetical protein
LRIHSFEVQAAAEGAKRTSLKTLFGIVLAAGAFAATQAPKELFTHYGYEGAYTRYRAYTFLALIVVLGLVAYVYVSGRSEVGRSAIGDFSAQLGRVGQVLAYLDATLEFQSAESCDFGGSTAKQATEEASRIRNSPGSD